MATQIDSAFVQRVEALLQEEITPAEHALLQQELLDSPELLEVYLQQVDLHSKLIWQLDEAIPGMDQPAANRPQPVVQAFRPRVVVIAMAAAAAILLGVMALQRDGRPNAVPATLVAAGAPTAVDDHISAAILSARPIAWLSYETGMDVNVRALQLEARSHLSVSSDPAIQVIRVAPSVISLSSGGHLEIRLDSGAAVIVRGPAEFQLTSAMRGHLQNGSLIARVPSAAHGFTITTDVASVVDLGTAFYVGVRNQNETEVQITEGAVEVTAIQSTTQQVARALKAGNAVLARADGLGEIDYQPPQGFPPFSNLEFSGHYVHWPFDEGVGTVTEAGARDGSFQGVLRQAKNGDAEKRWIHGRFGYALSFDGSGEWVETTYPGLAGDGARTIAFWVKLPPDLGVDEGHSLVSWGQGEALPSKRRRGSKWQMHVNNGTKGGTPGAIRTEIGPGWVVADTDLRDGKWHHIACVFLGGGNPQLADRILHYVDGRLEGISYANPSRVHTETQAQKSVPVQFGRHIEAHDRVKFRGALDEIYMFDVALGPEQIFQLMKTNTIQGGSVSVPE